MMYLGDFAASSVVRFMFATNLGTGARADPSSAWEAADIRVYKDGSTTERSSTAGYTVTSTYDSMTGITFVAIDTSDNTDAGFYAAGSTYHVVLYPDETVDSVSIAAVLAEFSIERLAKVNVTQFGGSAGTFSGGRPEVNTTHLAGTAYASADFSTTMKASINAEADTALSDYGPLKPTTAGRTIDVTAGGCAGIDWGNVEAPTTTVGLSGTTIATSQVVASVTGAVGSVTGAVGSVTGAVGSVTGNVGGNVTGSVGSVVGAVGSVTGNVGGNVTGTIGGLTAAALAQFFTTDTTKTYADAIPKSVVYEMAENAGGGGGSTTVPQIIGGVTKSGSTYYVTYALVLDGALQTSGLGTLSVTFYDEDGTDLTFSGTPAASAAGLIYASGTLGTAITDNRPVMVKVAVTKSAVAYSTVLPAVSIA